MRWLQQCMPEGQKHEQQAGQTSLLSTCIRGSARHKCQSDATTEVQGLHRASNNNANKGAGCGTAVRVQMSHLEAQHTQVPHRSQQKVVGQELQTPDVSVSLETEAHPVTMNGAAFEEGTNWGHGGAALEVNRVERLRTEGRRSFRQQVKTGGGGGAMGLGVALQDLNQKGNIFYVSATPKI